MIPQILKYRLWAMALRRNPQQVIFYPRVPPGTTPTTGYPLLRATYIDEERDVMEPGVLKIGTRQWTLYAVDLMNAQAPNPKREDRIVDAQGFGWTIKFVKTVEMDAAFECDCLKELPTNAAIN